jgi:small subunit ribosomal protein S19
VHFAILDNIIKNQKRSIIRTKSRSSVILQSFIGLVFEVYTGRSYSKVYIDEKMVGHKLGEFAYTRKIGKIHEKKMKKLKSTKK